MNNVALNQEKESANLAEMGHRLAFTKKLQAVTKM